MLAQRARRRERVGGAPPERRCVSSGRPGCDGRDRRHDGSCRPGCNGSAPRSAVRNRGFSSFRGDGVEELEGRAPKRGKAPVPPLTAPLGDFPRAPGRLKRWCLFEACHDKSTATRRCAETISQSRRRGRSGGSPGRGRRGTGMYRAEPHGCVLRVPSPGEPDARGNRRPVRTTVASLDPNSIQRCRRRSPSCPRSRSRRRSP